MATSMTSLVLSIIGTLLGFTVYFKILRNFSDLTQAQPMRFWLMNSSSLAFIFSMFVELTLGSKVFGVVVPMLVLALSSLWLVRPVSQLFLIEVVAASIMSVSMSIMFIGMIAAEVVWVIEICLISVEFLLLMALRRSKRLA